MNPPDGLRLRTLVTARLGFGFKEKLSPQINQRAKHQQTDSKFLPHIRRRVET